MRRTLIAAVLPAAVWLSFSFPAALAYAGTASVEMSRVPYDENSGTNGYLELRDSGMDVMLSPDGILLPGDSIYGTLMVKNSADDNAVLSLTSVNRGNQAVFKAMELSVHSMINTGPDTFVRTEIYSGKLSEVKDLYAAALSGKETAELKFCLTLPKDAGNEINGKRLDAALRISGTCRDYMVISWKDEPDRTLIDRYISLYDNRCFYSESGECALDGKYFGRNEAPDCSPDHEVYPGYDGKYGTQSDYYIEESTGKRIYPGKDNVFGTGDDSFEPPYTPFEGGSGGGVAAGYLTAVKTGERMYDEPSESAVTSVVVWKLIDPEKHIWTCTVDGIRPENKWVYAYWEGANASDWYYFNGEGIMQTDWQVSASGKWYHLHGVSDGRLGAMDRGFYYETQDSKWYMLDPGNGCMRTGWQFNGGNWYYFSESGAEQTWFYKSSLGKWLYDITGKRSLGSMYADEMTPDGHYVDANGVRTP